VTARKGKPRQDIVFKPYLKGHAVSLPAAKRGLRILAYQIAFAFLFLLIGPLFNFESLVLRLLINLAMVTSLMVLLYIEGTRAGVEDVSFAQIALQRQQNGKTIDVRELNRCYHPAKGFVTALLGTLPLLLISLLFALTVQPRQYVLGPLPDWVAAYERRADIGLALSYYHEQRSLTLPDLLGIAVRLFILPFINMVSQNDTRALCLVDRLSPLLILLPPCAYGTGYLRGPVLRARVHGAIESDNRRRQRRRKATKSAEKPRRLV
jgi:hypothetical protein